MKRLKIFSLAYQDDQLCHIPKDSSIIPVQLSKLELIRGLKNDNQLSECRVFLSRIPDSYIYHYANTDASLYPVEFIAFASWRYNDKWPKNKSILEWKIGDWQEDTVYVASRSIDWYAESEQGHPGMAKYLIEMAQVTGFRLDMRNGPLCNNFVVTPKVYAEFQEFFRKVFFHFHEKYGYNFDFYVIPEHRNRTAACLYERVAALYFSNRTDLKMVDFL
jgi:hypothetical protein